MPKLSQETKAIIAGIASVVAATAYLDSKASGRMDRIEASIVRTEASIEKIAEIQSNQGQRIARIEGKLESFTAYVTKADRVTFEYAVRPSTDE